jgi:uncharacterized protein YlxW (UPF0749 family)
MGCAADQGMKAQVDQLQQRAHQQDAQIADLEARAAKLKDQSVTTSQSAWEWTSQHAQEAWNSDISQDARARFQKCWNDLKTSTK